MTAAEVVQLRDADWLPQRPWACPDGMLVCSSQVERDVWLEQRQTGLGASDVAAVFGVSRWQTAWDVWALKTGRVQPEPENEAMLRGRILEDGIADLWVRLLPADQPVRLKRAGMMRHRRHAWMLATVDRLSVCRAGRCVVEIKSAVDFTDWEGDEVPEAYQLQTQQQLAVTGRDHAHVVVLGPRLTAVERVLPRDEWLIERMTQHLAGWWQRHVVEDTEPAATAGAAEALARLYGNPTDPDAVAELPVDLWDARTRIKALDAQAADAKRAADDLRARLRQVLGNAVVAKAAGEVVATWKPTKKIAGINADWRKANPDLVAQYTRLVEVPELDVDALVADHPELLGDGGHLYRVRQLRLA